MENLQISHNQVGKIVRNSYQKLFSEPELQGIEPQMPKAQLRLFLKQSIDRKYRVTVQFNSQHTIYETTGSLTDLPSDRFILKDRHQNVTYLLSLSDIRFIKKVD